VKLWIARAAALLALLAAGAAVSFAVTSVDSGPDELTREEAEQAAQRIDEVNGPVGRQLEALEPGASPREAQDAVRAAAERTRAMLDDGTGEGSLADLLDETLQAELAYLDALGSTLNNPRSPLKGAIRQRGVELRDLIQRLGGDHRLVRGGAELVAYSDARIG
jgi:hypothetical protein